MALEPYIKRNIAIGLPEETAKYSESGIFHLNPKPVVPVLIGMVYEWFYLKKGITRLDKEKRTARLNKLKQMISFLVKHRLFVNEKDRSGRTALMIASENENYDLVNFLNPGTGF